MSLYVLQNISVFFDVGIALPQTTKTTTLRTYSHSHCTSFKIQICRDIIHTTTHCVIYTTLHKII